MIVEGFDSPIRRPLKRVVILLEIAVVFAEFPPDDALLQKRSNTGASRAFPMALHFQYTAGCRDMTCRQAGNNQKELNTWPNNLIT